MSSEKFSSYILQSAGVATCPGNYFGNAGEGYVRLCFANSEENIREAMQRIKKAIHSL
jgi:aminotransferase